MTTYYSLLTRESAAAPWQIAHGSYSRADVHSERADMRDHDCRASNLKVIETAPDQASIDAAVRKLNAVRVA
jgi:hypothetical protein